MKRHKSDSPKEMTSCLALHFFAFRDTPSSEEQAFIALFSSKQNGTASGDCLSRAFHLAIHICVFSICARNKQKQKLRLSLEKYFIAWNLHVWFWLSSLQGKKRKLSQLTEVFEDGHNS